MRAFAATKMARALFAPTAHHLDQFVGKLTRGKRSFVGITAGIPSVTLTTMGAKSGKPRTVVLLGIPHPDGVAVVAANYGGARHPAWYHNIKANPAVTVTNGVKIYPGLTKEEAWAGDRHIEAFVLTRT